MGIYELLLIAIIIVLQVIVFRSVYNKIHEYKNFFPSSFQSIEIRKFKIHKEALSNKSVFESFLANLHQVNAEEHLPENDPDVVELLVLPEFIKKENIDFSEVVVSTNAYLCKNKGASADFNILQDICERHIQKIDNSIGNLINVPLYIGLAGTFIGIIFGLMGINFSSGAGQMIVDSSSISQLLNGVVAAMFASLIGLGFTVASTALFYKPAAYKNDSDKNQYYDFIQRELLPVLNIGMAGSLTTFRSVLDHFIIRFGENIGDYKDSAILLNDNLQKQYLVLEEINKLSLTRASTAIAQTFADLKESSEHLQTFKEYQKGLNENIVEVRRVVDGLNGTISQYKDFNKNLDLMGRNVTTSLELQKQFKDSLEVHFPTISDHRVIWRNHVDEVNNDVKVVYKELTKYFEESTSYIQSFVSNNENFFTGLNDIQNSIKVFVKNSEIQNQQFRLLTKSLDELRNDQLDSQRATYELNKDLVKAIKDLSNKVSKLEVVNSATNE